MKELPIIRLTPQQLDRLSGSRPTFLTGLIGKDIQRSKSPRLHEQEAKELGVVLIYELLDLAVMKRGTEALGQLLDEAERLGFAGLNITHPAKQRVMPLLSELSEEARVIGAVNTVKFQGGRRRGFNTDASGFADSFRRGLADVPLERVVQIGAGGAGAATAYAMLTLGAQHLTLIDATPDRAADLALHLSKFFDPARLATSDDPVAALRASQGLVHATPTGMREHPGLPVPRVSLHRGLWVAEIVYFPLETELLKSARALGCRTLDGGGMAVFQAAAAFDIFTDHTSDRARMLRHFRDMPPD